MKFTKLLFTTAIAVFGLALGSQAQPTTYPTAKASQVYHYMVAPSPYLFNSQELGIDIGPTYTTPEGTTIFAEGGGHGVWGVDGAVTYWIKRYAGLGFETGVVNTRTQNDLVFSHLDVTADGRIPLDLLANSFPFRNTAITGRAGFGRELRVGQYETTLAGGLEYRFTQHIGAGGECQHVWMTDKANNENKIFAYLVVAF